jgi:hypothetical protein
MGIKSLRNKAGSPFKFIIPVGLDGDLLLYRLHQFGLPFSAEELPRVQLAIVIDVIQYSQLIIARNKPVFAECA